MDTWTDECSDSCRHQQSRGRMFGRAAASTEEKNCAAIQLNLGLRRSLSTHTFPAASSFAGTSTQLPLHQISSAPQDRTGHLFVCRFVSECYTLSGAAAALYIICHIGMNYASRLRMASPCGLSIWLRKASCGGRLHPRRLPGRGSFRPDHWLWCSRIARGHAGRCTAVTPEAPSGHRRLALANDLGFFFF